MSVQMIVLITDSGLPHDVQPDVRAELQRARFCLRRGVYPSVPNCGAGSITVAASNFDR